MTETTNLAGKKVLIVVTEDWAFLLHRLPIGLALRDAGADVVIVARVRGDADRIRAAGLRVAPIRLERSGRNPLCDLRTLGDLIKLYRRERPDLVHHVALKPVLYGSIAAWITGIPAVVNALGGMGFLFIETSPTARILRGAVQVLFRLLMNRHNSRMILQNPDDMDLLADAAKVRRDRLVLIRGSGVDIDEYKTRHAGRRTGDRSLRIPHAARQRHCRTRRGRSTFTKPRRRNPNPACRPDRRQPGVYFRKKS